MAQGEDEEFLVWNRPPDKPMNFHYRTPKSFQNPSLEIGMVPGITVRDDNISMPSGYGARPSNLSRNSSTSVSNGSEQVGLNIPHYNHMMSGLLGINSCHGDISGPPFIGDDIGTNVFDSGFDVDYGPNQSNIPDVDMLNCTSWPIYHQPSSCSDSDIVFPGDPWIWTQTDQNSNFPSNIRPHISSSESFYSSTTNRHPSFLSTLNHNSGFIPEFLLIEDPVISSSQTSGYGTSNLAGPTVNSSRTTGLNTSNLAGPAVTSSLFEFGIGMIPEQTSLSSNRQGTGLSPSTESGQEMLTPNIHSNPSSPALGDGIYFKDVKDNNPANEYCISSTEVPNGPVKKVWVVRKKNRGRRPGQTVKQKDVQKPSSPENASLQPAPRRRRRFEDMEKRKETAHTRMIGCCIACKIKKSRCSEDPNDPNGPCSTCKRGRGPLATTLPCIRDNITHALLYREQDKPYQLFSKRWQSMEMVDISNWASAETKTIQLTQVFLDGHYRVGPPHAFEIPYAVEVRRFIPEEGDMLEEQWMSGTILRTHQIPPFAIADMSKTAETLEAFIDENIDNYLKTTLYARESLIPRTYTMASKYFHKATDEEKRLLTKCLRLWVACRKTSNPERICGREKLGVAAVIDPTSPWYEYLPMPPILIAQMECIIYSRILRPTSKQVLAELLCLIQKKKKRYWFTIYLSLFILLHNCSMITKRDEEYARQISLKKKYANPEGIQGIHQGINIILAYFHYGFQGGYPVSTILDSSNNKKCPDGPYLDEEQIGFVVESMTSLRERAQTINQARETRDFGHELYWISQLYDDHWVPGPTA